MRIGQAKVRKRCIVILHSLCNFFCFFLGTYFYIYLLRMTLKHHILINAFFFKKKNYLDINNRHKSGYLQRNKNTKYIVEVDMTKVSYFSLSIIFNSYVHFFCLNNINLSFLGMHYYYCWFLLHKYSFGPFYLSF